MQLPSAPFSDAYPVIVLLTTELDEDVVTGDYVVLDEHKFRKRVSGDSTPVYRGIMLKDARAGQFVTLYSNGAVTYD